MKDSESNPKPPSLLIASPLVTPFPSLVLHPYRDMLLGWEWHLKGNVCILKIRVVQGIQSPFFDCLRQSS